ncbi:MAG: GDP-L-fucose synthase [Acidimicrobiales bacterium]
MSDYWSRKKVLVTGGSGFLGTSVVAKFRAAGCTELTVPRSAQHDLRNADAASELVEAVQPDLVIHLAARVGGIGANMARPAELYLENLLLGTNVIEACRHGGVDKLVVVGTICSYPKHSPVPFSETDLWNGYPEQTNAPYGIAKLAQLVHLQANREQYGQCGIYLMPTNLYGPGDKFHSAVSHVIPALIKKCVDACDRNDSSISVWGSGSATREFLYVDDAAEGILLAAQHFDGAEPVNLGAHDELAIKDLVKLIAELTGFDGEIVWDKTKPDGQPRRCVDTTRAKQEFGFQASTTFKEGLQKTISWYQANRAEAERK